MIFASLLCIFAPFDIAQLVFASLGALGYATLQALSPRSGRTQCQSASEREQRKRPYTAHAAKREHCKREVTLAKAGGSPARPGASTRPQQNSAPAMTKPDVYHPSSVPVIAPKFQSVGWEGEVNELVSSIMPGSDEDKAVQRLVQHVKHTLQALFPEVEVTGFAHGSIKHGKAFGVAVPEVDIVANVNPVVLAQRLQLRSHAQQKWPECKLQKSAVRACTDRLVQSGGLKFRRSAFRGEEPRVTLLVPTSLGIFTDPIPVDFTVNSVTPFYTAALLAECGQIEPRAKALILFVKRWAKDRGICHSSKGHLSPYLWSLLVIYFMQVGVESEGALLPVAEAFAISSGLAKQAPSSRKTSPRRQQSDASASDKVGKNSVAQLFCEFVNFYTKRFNWRNEAISIRLGQRAPPSVSLPLHVVLSDIGVSEVGLTIEDPFKAGHNLGTCMNSVTLTRLREELSRASQLCARVASLTEILEPWVPAEFAPGKGSGSSPEED